MSAEAKIAELMAKNEELNGVVASVMQKNREDKVKFNELLKTEREAMAEELEVQLRDAKAQINEQVNEFHRFAN